MPLCFLPAIGRSWWGVSPGPFCLRHVKIFYLLNHWCWRRKATGQVDSILKKKDTLSYIPSEVWVLCLVAMEITYLQPSRPPRLIDTRFHTKISLCQKECNNPLCNLCNLYGTHWWRLQCMTSWAFWLWIMAVTWLYLPLTFSRLGLRNLEMWAWAHILKIYTVFCSAYRVIINIFLNSIYMC